MILQSLPDASSLSSRALSLLRKKCRARFLVLRSVSGALSMPAPKPMRKIIVNADDFGMSAEVNRAIVEAFENNVISSTTLMANMPGFDEACELAHRHRLVSKIGLHLNLTAVYPLSSPIRRCAGFAIPMGCFALGKLGSGCQRKRGSR